MLQSRKYNVMNAKKIQPFAPPLIYYQVLQQSVVVNNVERKLGPIIKRKNLQNKIYLSII